MSEVFVPCGNCRLLSFYVRFDARADVAVVVCAACRTELIRATMVIPETSGAIRIDPI